MATRLEAESSKLAESRVAGTARVRFRGAEPADAEPLAHLMTQLGYPTHRDEMAVRLRGILPRTDTIMTVAVRQGRVVGVVAAMLGVALEMNERSGRVIVLIVAEDLRGRGIGTRLLAQAESWIKAHGAAACLINSGTHRTRTHHFYEREGYEATGLRFHKAL